MECTVSRDIAICYCSSWRTTNAWPGHTTCTLKQPAELTENTALTQPYGAQALTIFCLWGLTPVYTRGILPPTPGQSEKPLLHEGWTPTQEKELPVPAWRGGSRAAVLCRDSFPASCHSSRPSGCARSCPCSEPDRQHHHAAASQLPSTLNLTQCIPLRLQTSACIFFHKLT